MPFVFGQSEKPPAQQSGKCKQVRPVYQTFLIPDGWICPLLKSAFALAHFEQSLASSTASPSTALVLRNIWAAPTESDFLEFYACALRIHIARKLPARHFWRLRYAPALTKSAMPFEQIKIKHFG